ncbi:MAG TPA: hypothetical protein VFV11_05760 [Solimonas sp.]|nr:hypothetical protein [Solimonas sp.]
MPRPALTALLLAMPLMATAGAAGQDADTHAQVLQSIPVFAPQAARPCPGEPGPARPDPAPGAGFLSAGHLTASLPGDTSGRLPSQGRCDALAEEEPEILGYDVIYRYHGRTYRTRMPYDPGDRIPVRVDVRAGRD